MMKQIKGLKSKGIASREIGDDVWREVEEHGRAINRLSIVGGDIISGMIEIIAKDVEEESVVGYALGFPIVMPGRKLSGKIKAIDQ